MRKARPTTYNGIQMRSRLEADYAAYLDARRLRWEYEPECFASGCGQWLPDFGYSTTADGPLKVFTEVKPAAALRDYEPGTNGWVEHVDVILKRMTIAWASRPDAALRLEFWEYGGPTYLCVHAWHGNPWWAATANSDFDLLWCGMGQSNALPGGARSQDEETVLACRIARGHWECSCGCDARGEHISPGDVCEHLRAVGSTQRFPTLREAWPTIVGDDLAAHTRPGEERDGEFTVYADSAAWTTQARLMHHRLCQSLNEFFQAERVQKVKVKNLGHVDGTNG